jgi:zinc protease
MNSNIYSTTLDNGLQVILKEVHTAPIVSSWLWYRVGSRNEVEGATGIAHWVEHMMFKGSAHYPKGSICAWWIVTGATPMP